VPDSKSAKGNAEIEYDSNTREFLYGLFSSKEITKDPPTFTDPLRSAGGWVGRIGRPQTLPPWLSQAELDYFVSEFQRAGFRGAVNYYRNFDRNWELMAPFRNKKMTQPVLFIAGKNDLVLSMFGGEEICLALMKGEIPHVESCIVPDCGHWTQQEKPTETNAEIIKFFSKHYPKFKPCL